MCESKGACTKKWGQLFDEIDSNASGTVDSNELLSHLKSKCPKVSHTTVKTLLSELDVNKDGKVTKEEFISVMSKTNIHNKDEMSKAFKKIDKDNSGFITKCELKAAMKAKGIDCGNEEIDAIMKSVDKDDGKIDYKEFVAAMQ